MNTAPIGRMMNMNALKPPVVVAASASSPSGATINASVKPITDCVARASTIGQASVRSGRRLGGPGIGPDVAALVVTGNHLDAQGRTVREANSDGSFPK